MSTQIPLQTCSRLGGGVYAPDLDCAVPPEANWPPVSLYFVLE